MTRDESRLRLLSALQIVEAGKAHLEGRAAGFGGEPESACPLPEDRWSRGVWTCGHREGRRRCIRALLSPELGD